MPVPPPQLPSGIVTFVFTDIEQSTRLLRRLGTEYADVLDRHFALLRQAWAAHGGHVVDSVGDSDFVVFEDADEAVQACADAQRLLTAERWPGDRCGHAWACTRASRRRGATTYVALAVHQAARVMSAAHGGQVLVSGDDRRAPVVAALADVDGRAARAASGSATSRSRSRCSSSPGHGLPSDFPAVRAVPADGHNLVAPADVRSSGGDDELAEVAALAGAGAGGHAHRPRRRRQDPARDRGGAARRIGVAGRRLAGRSGPGAGARRRSVPPSAPRSARRRGAANGGATSSSTCGSGEALVVARRLRARSPTRARSLADELLTSCPAAVCWRRAACRSGSPRGGSGASTRCRSQRRAP